MHKEYNIMEFMLCYYMQLYTGEWEYVMSLYAEQFILTAMTKPLKIERGKTREKM